MLRDSVKLGVKNLMHRQLRSWLTMIGIFIGIATVVSLIALGAGLKAAILSQFSSLGTDRLIISAKGGGFGPPGQGTAVALTTKDLDVVQNANYVTLASGRLIQAAQVEFNNKKKPQFVGSIPKESDERNLIIKLTNIPVLEGRWPKSSDGYRVIIGNDFTDPDRFGKAIRVGDNIIINDKKIEVVGILEKKGSPQFDSAIFMNEAAMRELFDIPDEYSAIVVQVSSPEILSLAKATIEKDLRSSRGVKERKEDFTVETPGELLKTVSVIIGGVTAVLVGIAAISLLVGGIGIMNTMYTAVLERTREIGIMKAVGARNKDVLQIFLFESGMLGLMGAIIGAILGILLSKLVAIIGTAALGPGIIRADISWPLIVGALLFGFLVGSIAGTLPAYEAAKMSPVEALRQ